MNATEKPRTVAIAFCSDSLMEVPLHVAASSLLRHLPEDVVAHFYFLLVGFSESGRTGLRKTLEATGHPCQVTFLPEEPVIDAFRNCAKLHGSTAPYYRLMLPRLIDEPRFLYLDADTLPLIDVTPLFEVEMGEHVTGFIVDGQVAWNLEHQFFYALGRSADSPTFNSGVMLARPPLWQQQGCWEKVLAFLEKYGPQLLSHDQTVLNALFAENCFHMNPRFNIKVYPRRDSSISQEPGIYHFVGVPKPWDMGGRTLLPYAGPWFDALKTTALPASKKTLWLNAGYWKRAPHLLGGYKRLLKNARPKS